MLRSTQFSSWVFTFWLSSSVAIKKAAPLSKIRYNNKEQNKTINRAETNNTIRLIKVLTQQPSSEPCSYIPFLFMSELSEQPKGRVKNSTGTLVQFEINMLKTNDNWKRYSSVILISGRKQRSSNLCNATKYKQLRVF